MASAEVILGNLVLASLIGALALMVGRGGRRAPLAHALWVMFFVKLITPPLVPIPLPIPVFRDSVVSEAAPPAEDVAAAGEAMIPSAAETTSATGAATISGEASGGWALASVDWTTTLTLIWAVGLSYLLVRGLIRVIRFRRLLAECGTDDPEATAYVADLLSSEAAGRQPPRVVRVSFRVSPMLVGFAGRPTIVCPEQLWLALSEEERHAFLAHEAAHFRRRDHLVRWLEWFATAMYWWFPGVYFGRHQLERHEEASCDAWAVRMLGTKPRHYAEALLRVVDFISDHSVGMPRMASGMQPTATLEERLRLLMKSDVNPAPSRAHCWMCGVACGALWLVYPVAYRIEWQRPSEPRLVAAELPDTTEPLQLTKPSQKRVLQLPEPPSGFWNAPAKQTWAGFALTISGCELVAHADKGIQIKREGADPLLFDEQTMTSIAEIPFSGRVVIGDSEGNVRIWDLLAGQPVSLLGRHPASVSSLCVSADGSVYSADVSGTVIRWALQSGQILARWTNEQRVGVQSVRVSEDGAQVLALAGDWRHVDGAKVAHVLNGKTLLSDGQIPMNPQTAIVFQDASGDWRSADWSGTVTSLTETQPLARIAKHQVSALLLSQQASVNLP